MSRRKSMKVWVARLLAAVLVLSMISVFGVSTTAWANKSPDNDYETDSSNILLSDPDTSIEDIADLMMGFAPAEVLGDSTLKDFSTLAIFSVTALDGYDFSDIETTKIRGAAINDDMTVDVRFLPVDGSWQKLDFQLEDGSLSVQFPSEGQVAIFVKDQVLIDDNIGGNPKDDQDDDQKNDPGKAPQTGDKLPLYIAMGCVALVSAFVSLKKLKK